MSDDAEIVNLDDCSMKPALIMGGIVTFVITLIPISNLACCLPMVLGGFIATARFTSAHQITVQLKTGMKVAILACMVGFGASAIVYDVLWAVFGIRLDLAAYVALLTQLSEALPEASEQLQDSIDRLEAQTFGVGLLVQQLIWIVVSSGIGGAIATAMFKKGPLAQ